MRIFPKILFITLIVFQVLSAGEIHEDGISVSQTQSLENVQCRSRIKIGRKKHRAPKDLDYPYNPYVELEIWEQLKPYFLPFDHPVKPILDQIFQSDRVTLDRDRFIAAGFKVNAPKQPGNLVVGRHPRLKGFLIKAYLDTQDACEWHNFFRRVTGAKSIQKCIARHGFQKEFAVPKKWIYPLAIDPSPPDKPEYFRKNFVLVVEDMHLLSPNENKKAFKQKINPQILDHLFLILSEEGLIDSVFAGNIPFNREGRISFIDTEHHHLWPIRYEMLTRYLSPEMRVYWQSLSASEQ